MKTWEKYKKYVKSIDPIASKDIRECEDLSSCEEIEITLTAKFLISDNSVYLESGVLHPWINAEVLQERKVSEREAVLIRKIINRTFQELYGVNLKGFIKEYINAEKKYQVIAGKEVELAMQIGNHYVTAIEDIGIERTDAYGNQVICKGYYCQVYDNEDLKNEVDNFCLALGYEIEDMSEETLEAGIRHYMGEEETEGFSQQM